MAQRVLMTGNWTAFYLIPLEGGTPRRITPAKALDIDMAPAFAPDRTAPRDRSSAESGWPSTRHLTRPDSDSPGLNAVRPPASTRRNPFIPAAP